MVRLLGIFAVVVIRAGMLIAQPSIVVSPTSLDFDTVRIGTYVQGYVHVSNTGTEVLSIDAAVTGDDFELMEFPTHWDISPQDSGVALRVRCHPFVNEGNLSGDLTLTSNDPNLPTVVVPLSAVGSHTGGLPAIFDLLTPADSSYQNGESFLMQWQILRVNNPIFYTVTIHHPNGTELTYPTQEDTFRLQTVSALDSGVWYSWWVTAAFFDFSQQSETVRHFRIGHAPMRFDLISPPDQTDITGDHQMFTWHALHSDSAQVSYELWIAAVDTSVSHLRVHYPVGADSSYGIVFEVMFADGPYRWWVEATTAGQTTVSNETWEFHLGAEGVTNSGATLLPKRFEVASVYPNPFNAETQIRLLVPVPGMVQAEVFDLLGRRVAMLVNGPLIAGEHVLDWKPDGASGIYLLRVRDVRGGIDLRKLVFLR